MLTRPRLPSKTVSSHSSMEAAIGHMAHHTERLTCSDHRLREDSRRDVKDIAWSLS